MNLVSKRELREMMDELPKDNIIDMLHDAWAELYRISNRANSLWYMKDWVFQEGDVYKRWKEEMSTKSDGPDGWDFRR